MTDILWWALLGSIFAYAVIAGTIIWIVWAIKDKRTAARRLAHRIALQEALDKGIGRHDD